MRTGSTYGFCTALPNNDGPAGEPKEGAGLPKLSKARLHAAVGEGTTGANIAYLWTTTDGNIIDDETTLMPEIDAPGTYTLMVTNTISGCTNTASVEVVFSNAFPEANAEPDGAIVCENSISLTPYQPAFRSLEFDESNNES